MPVELGVWEQIGHKTKWPLYTSINFINCMVYIEIYDNNLYMGSKLEGQVKVKYNHTSKQNG